MHPLPRFRVIIALNRRVMVSELGASLAEQAAKWRASYYEVGRQIGIEAFDEKCSDLNRLFFSHAHRRPKGVESWHHRVDGQGINFDAVLASLDLRPKSAQADDKTEEAEKRAEAPAGTNSITHRRTMTARLTMSSSSPSGRSFATG